LKAVDEVWKKACKDSGIGIRLFHDFRWTAVGNRVDFEDELRYKNES
jgi:hypothetical protein